MKQIPLTQNQVTLVSDKDFMYLSQWKWHTCQGKYAVRNRKISDGPGPSAIRMHRVIAQRMGLNLGEDIDHRDGDGLNNQRHNLRAASKTGNGQNRGPNSNNLLGVKGVYRHTNGKYRAQIAAQGRRIHLGYFTTLDQATNAYKQAAKKYFGEYAYNCRHQ